MKRSPAPDRARGADDRPPTHETAAGGEPPTCHIDLCVCMDGWLLVLGWVVRAPSAEPDVALLIGEKRVPPVATFPRPDVIDFFKYTRSSVVRTSDIAFSFVAAAPAAAVSGAMLLLQGHARGLEPVLPPAASDLVFLDRYVEALRPLPVSPAAEAARRTLQSLRIRQAARGAQDADAGPQEAPASVADLLRACHAEGPLFEAAEAIGPMLALLAIHQRGPDLAHRHRAMLQALRARGCAVVVINSSPGSEAAATALREGLADGAITRSDHGRDIASWLLALDLLGGRLGGARHVLFCNDSFFGPFDRLENALSHQAAAEADLWALTDSWEHGWHAQSSFFALSARALASDAMRQFRADYPYPDERAAVVRQGEIGLSRALVQDRTLAVRIVAPYAALARRALDEGSRTLQALRELPEHETAADRDSEPAIAFTRALLADLRNGVPRNPQHVFWHALMSDCRIPFVKRELLERNPAGVADYWRILPTVTAVFGPGHAERIEADMRLGSQLAPVA